MWKRLIDAIIFRLVHGPATLGPAPLPPFDVTKLDLQPGQFLVLRFPGRLSMAQVECLRQQIDGCGICPKGKILVLEGGADLAVITPSPAEPAAPQMAA